MKQEIKYNSIFALIIVISVFVMTFQGMKMNNLTLNDYQSKQETQTTDVNYKN